MIFLTPSAKHLKIPNSSYSLSKYPSGEIKIQIKENVKNKIVFIIGSVLPDPKSLLELMILSDGLIVKGARPKLIIPYLAYARQDKPEKGEPFVAKVICKILNTIKYSNKFVIDAHNPKLRKFFDFVNVIPISIFKKELSKISDPTIIAPDKGSKERAKALASLLGCDIAFIEKKRLGAGKTKILKLKGKIQTNNAIIFDDMIDTGNTLINAAKLIKKQGVKNIYVAATHGLFSGNSIKNLEKASIKKIFVTNTMPQKSKKIKTLKIEPLLKTIIKHES